MWYKFELIDLFHWNPLIQNIQVVHSYYSVVQKVMNPATVCVCETNRWSTQFVCNVQNADDVSDLNRFNGVQISSVSPL